MLGILTFTFDFGGRNPDGDSEPILTPSSRFGGRRFFKNFITRKKYIFGQVKIPKNYDKDILS